MMFQRSRLPLHDSYLHYFGYQPRSEHKKLHYEDVTWLFKTFLWISGVCTWQHEDQYILKLFKINLKNEKSSNKPLLFSSKYIKTMQLLVLDTLKSSLVWGFLYKIQSFWNVIHTQIPLTINSIKCLSIKKK